MQNKKKALIILLALPALLAAQKTYTYQGGRISLKDHKVTVTHVGNLLKDYKQSFQGMDIWGDTLVSLQHTGMASLYRFDGSRLERFAQFPLGSFGNNHANVASFSRRFLYPGDKLPLLYVTRCRYVAEDSLHQLLYVERINPDTKSSELVQTIAYKEPAATQQHTTQWVLDNENGFLYGFGNTWESTGNRHFLRKFRIPAYNGPQDSLKVLTQADLLEDYYLEDYYNVRPFQPTIQGMHVKNGLLFLPMGVGTQSRPSVLYIWNLGTRSMQAAIDLQEAIPHEMEDCAEYKNDLIVQVQKHIYKISFEE